MAELCTKIADKIDCKRNGTNGFMITHATNGIILLIGRNLEISIVLLPYSLKYCSHIVMYFFLWREGDVIVDQ